MIKDTWVFIEMFKA